MKRLLIAVLAILMLSVSGHAQEPQTAAEHGKVYGAVHYVGRHVKETFTDVKRDPVWGTVVVGTIVANGLDTGTSAYLFSHHLAAEGNPLLPRNPSMGFLVSTAVFETLTQLTAEHMVREHVTNWCKKDAANKDSMYNRIAQSRGVNPDPKGCTYGIDAVFMTPWGYKGEVINSNIQKLP